MSDYDEARAVAFDAVMARKLAYLFNDNAGNAIAGLVDDEVRNNCRASDDDCEAAIEAAEREIDALTVEAVAGLVAKRLTEQRAKVAAQREALLARHGLDMGSLARAIVGVGK